MNFSKLFLMISLGLSLNNIAWGMQDDKDKKRNLDDEVPEQSNKKNKQDNQPKYSQFSSEALLDAVQQKNCELEAIKILLEVDDDGYRADPNLQDQYGCTSLHRAAQYGKTACVQLLLEYGAHVNVRHRYGSTPLYWAAGNGSTACIQLLLDNGADVNAQDDEGKMPLHNVKWNTSTACIQLLLDNGADVKAQDIYGLTPLHKAARNDNTACVQLLLDYMKKLTLAKDYLTYFCSSDKDFQTRACRVMFCAKEFLKKHKQRIPKPILNMILLIFWQLKHPNDYRYNFLLRPIEDRKKDLKDWVNMNDNYGKTAWNIGYNKEIKNMIEKFKRDNNFN